MTIVFVDLKTGEITERALTAAESVELMPPATEPTSADQVAAIDAVRDATIAAGVVHEGVLHYADLTFLTELLGRVMGYQAGVYTGQLPVRTRGQTTLMLDQAQHVALAAAVGAHRQAAYAASWAAKDAL